MKQDYKPPKKPLIFYYVIFLALLILVNVFLTPRIAQEPTSEVPYSEFMTAVEEGKVKEAKVTDSTIEYYLEEGAKKTRCITARISDIQLVDRLHYYGVTFKTSLPDNTATIVALLLNWVLPLGLMVLLGWLLMRQMTKNMGGGGAMSFGKSNAKVYVAAQTGKTFADVAGEDEAKAALKEIVDFLHSPEKYSAIGAKMPKGALLVGPPGTGKTLLAQAVAGEAGVPFFSISGSEFVEMFVGMGAARVRDLFKQATEKAPCIVFIDEIDTIGKKRDGAGSIGGNDEREQTLNQLLTEMDGFDGSKGVIILAATNRPDSLDQALLRPGRFDRRIPVELPDVAGREAILRVHAKDVRMAPDVNFRGIALATSGSSGADLANIINEGALLAVKEGRTEVEQRDLEEAVETVLAGYQRKGAVISPQEKRVVSYHEIGHALVAARQKSSAPVHKITIIPRTSGALGYTMQVDEDEHYLMTREELFNKITTLTAGRAAEELIFGEVTSGAANDIEQATKLARAMITRLGMSDEFGMTALTSVTNAYLGGDTSLACSEQTAAQIDKAVMNLIGRAHEKAAAILRENETVLHRLAGYLLEKETISGEEFMRILQEADAAAGKTAETPAEAAPVEGQPAEAVPAEETAAEEAGNGETAPSEKV